MNEKKQNHNTNPIVPEEDFAYEQALARKHLAEEAAREQETFDAAEARRKAERDAADERRKKLAQEKIELMKLKQGVIEEDEAELVVPAQEEPPVQMSAKKRIVNFWYHYKFIVLIAVFVVGLVSYFIYDMASKVEPDMKIIITTGNGINLRTKQVKDFFTPYAEDLNGDGKVVVSVYFVPMNPNADANTYQTSTTKLSTLVMSGEPMLFITDPLTDDMLVDVLADVTGQFPGSTSMTAEGLAFNDALLREKLGWAEMPDDMILGIRKVSATLMADEATVGENYNYAMSIFRKIHADFQGTTP